MHTAFTVPIPFPKSKWREVQLVPKLPVEVVSQMMERSRET